MPTLQESSSTSSSSLAKVAKPPYSVYERLPAEIRQMITGFAIQEKGDIEYKSGLVGARWKKGIRFYTTQNLIISAMAATSRTMYADIKVFERQFYKLNNFKVEDLRELYYWLMSLSREHAQSIRSLSTTLNDPLRGSFIFTWAPNVKSLTLDVSSLIMQRWSRDDTRPDNRQFEIMVSSNDSYWKFQKIKGAFRLLLFAPQLENLHVNISGCERYIDEEKQAEDARQQERQREILDRRGFAADRNKARGKVWEALRERMLGFKNTELRQFEERLRKLVRLPKEDRDLEALLGAYVVDLD